MEMGYIKNFEIFNFFRRLDKDHKKMPESQDIGSYGRIVKSFSIQVND